MTSLRLFCSVRIDYHKHKNIILIILIIFACLSACRCLVDAIITGSDSKFMARTAENKLQFQLEAFRFQGAESGLVSISKTEYKYFLLYIKCSKISLHLIILQTLYYSNSST